MFHEHTLPVGMEDADKTDRAKANQDGIKGSKKRTTAEDPLCGGDVSPGWIRLS